VAAGYGLKDSKDSLRLAEELRVEADEDQNKNLNVLPRSCHESAENLEKDRHYYEAEGVFPKRLIDETARRLRAFEDKNLWKDLAIDPEKIGKMIIEYVHYG